MTRPWNDAQWEEYLTGTKPDRVEISGGGLVMEQRIADLEREVAMLVKAHNERGKE